MDTPLRLAFRRLRPAPGIAELIRDKVSWLGQFCSHIIGCKVMVTVPHRRHAHGNHYAVRVTLAVPHATITVNREPPLNRTHEGLYAAIQDAFDAARRKLEDHVQRRRGG